VRGGATSIQVRLKDATPREIVAIATEMVSTLGVPIIVNDRADLALAAGAAGVHVGPADLPVKAIRRVVPADFVIGASYGDDAEFENARFADYVGIGPIAVSPSKFDAGSAIGIPEFRRLASRVNQPAVGVGGVTPALAKELFAAGASGVAVLSGIFGVSDPEKAAASFLSASGT
jgi:thiamine-phosphate pyrophosphorylase